MNEDEKINAVVKAALEDGVGVGDGMLASITAAAGRVARRRRAVRLMWRWAPVSLLAACVALAVAVGTAVRSEGTTEVVAAIDFLRVLDGEQGVTHEMSAGEALLAWQEAPCEDEELGEM